VLEEEKRGTTYTCERKEKKRRKKRRY